MYENNWSSIFVVTLFKQIQTARFTDDATGAKKAAKPYTTNTRFNNNCNNGFVYAYAA